MEKDATYTVNRQELIKMARESCEGNLRSSGNGRFTYGLSRKEEKEAKANRKANTSKKGAMANEIAGNRKVSSTSNTSALSNRQFSLKLLLIRTICASVVVLTVIIIDKFKISYESFDSNYIVKNIESNRVFDKAEEFFTTIQEGKIVDVFNGLD